MRNTSFILIASLLAAGALAWAVESCTSHVRASSAQAAAESSDTSAGSVISVAAPVPMVDKSRDTTLQTMVSELMPLFKRLSYKDPSTGVTVGYALFEPRHIVSGKRYPMVVFMADASTVGYDPTRAVSQGYGALVWATVRSQAENPCYILVPSFAGVAVDDSYAVTSEADAVLSLVRHVAEERQVDNRRIYATGQAMGGTLAMRYTASEPGLFAASVFVGSHCDPATVPMLAATPFVYINAGTTGRAAGCMDAVADILKGNVRRASWSARLPIDEQNKLAERLLDSGAHASLITFDQGTVLPSDGRGSELLYGFDCAYRLDPVRQWLFRQHL